jgi:uncharacterized protein YbjT (DUF2867 family)
VNIVTGAFGYIGRYITHQLLDSGEEVTTITTHPDKPNPFGDTVRAFPYNFNRPEELIDSLRGASTLYNTYWIRFEHGGATFQQSVENTRTLFECAKQAGIQRIVHISVTNPTLDSHLPYYHGKALQERSLEKVGLPYAIIRPTLVFGLEDILVNNIAWLIRRFPVFPIFGRGDYRLQPVFVGDLAKIAVAGGQSTEIMVIDAAGPETYSYVQMVRLIAASLKPRIKFIYLPAPLGIALGQLVGSFIRDVILTQDEARGLMESRLTSNQPPYGTTLFSEWVSACKNELGNQYHSELNRHFRWQPRGIR